MIAYLFICMYQKTHFDTFTKKIFYTFKKQKK